MEIGFVVAFLGGALALLSPCGALLLPAYFGTTVGSGGRLLLHSVVFFGGLVATLAPLGLGAGLLGAQLAGHRALLITVAGWLVVGLGLQTALGRGFDLRRLLPSSPAARVGAGSPRVGVWRSFVLGTVAGVAGFCAGPILGAVLTMAATWSPLVGAATLVVYGAGMVVPLLLLAMTWQRLGPRGLSALRGREVVLGPVRTHTTSLVSGALLIVVGAVFLRTNGMAALPELVPAATLSRLQGTAADAGAMVPDVVVIAAVAAAALAVWWWADRRRTSSTRGER